jgi:RNA polymerase sigma-70 factor (ECF subfamily)
MPSKDTDKPPGGGCASQRQKFEAAVTRLMDRLYGTALRLTRDPDDAEDIVAEALGQAWRRLDQLRDPGQLDAWLFRILHNTFVDACRRRRSRQDRETELDLDDSGDANDAGFSLFEQLHQPFLLWWGNPEIEFVDSLLQEDIQQALDGLPDAFRIVMVLVEVEGYSYEETAGLLGLPLGTVRSRLSRARGLLQKALWRQGREAGLVPGGMPKSMPVAGGGS